MDIEPTSSPVVAAGLFHALTTQARRSLRFALCDCGVEGHAAFARTSWVGKHSQFTTLAGVESGQSLLNHPLRTNDVRLLKKLFRKPLADQCGNCDAKDFFRNETQVRCAKCGRFHCLPKYFHGTLLTRKQVSDMQWKAHADKTVRQEA